MPSAACCPGGEILFLMPRNILDIHFKKTGLMRYISHLDLLRVFQRASRRADLPLFITQGFSPRPRIKIEPALKLGLESDNLRAEIVLSERISAEDTKKRLAKELPDGIEITAIEYKDV